MHTNCTDYLIDSVIFNAVIKNVKKIAGNKNTDLPISKIVKEPGII